METSALERLRQDLSEAVLEWGRRNGHTDPQRALARATGYSPSNISKTLKPGGSFSLRFARTISERLPDDFGWVQGRRLGIEAGVSGGGRSEVDRRKMLEELAEIEDELIDAVRSLIGRVRRVVRES